MPAFRPPAIPLVAHDPYFSVWSFLDDLNGDDTRHWTGRPQRLVGLLRLDGKTWRFCGLYDTYPAMRQTSVTVHPTRTCYTFEADGVALELTFITPAILDDLDLLSRPVTYLRWKLRSLDGRARDAGLYFDADGEWTIDNPAQPVRGARYRIEGLRTLGLGADRQEPLSRAGDDLRIDWGHLYLAAPENEPGDAAMGPAAALRDRFVKTGKLPESDYLEWPRAMVPLCPALAHRFDAPLADAEAKTGTLLFAYDDRVCVEFLRQRLEPYWRRHSMGAGELLRTAMLETTKVVARCEAFDDQMEKDLTRAGGEKYAKLCALAYRQAIAAHKLAADPEGRPLFFSKENFSNGCIATVDISYPSSPLFLLGNPKLVRAMIEPVLRYAGTTRWRFPFAPHDLGTYPLANGQVYGGGEASVANQMPVEECGNMLLLAAATVAAGVRADFLEPHWENLAMWADYLANHGLDPESQLCTDDFAGHLGHNVNLALKAILAVGAFAQLADRMGRDGKPYRAKAEEMAASWLERGNDGEATRLAYDKPGTWSLKYNLVWDRLLGLDLIPPEVAAREAAFYKKQMKTFGVALDSRGSDAKLDWQAWAACLAGDTVAFRAWADLLYDWADQTSSRAPLSDWYSVDTGVMRGFQARSVVGGLFLKPLMDRGLAPKQP